MKYRLQIVKADANDDIDIILEPDNDLEALDSVRDLKDSADDGWRLIKFRAGAVDDESDIETWTQRTFDTTDENNDPVTNTSVLELHTITDGASSVATYATTALAWTAIQALNDSDGFTLIDELLGPTPRSLIVYERASLWNNDGVNKSHGKANNHGRTGNNLI